MPVKKGLGPADRAWGFEDGRRFAAYLVRSGDTVEIGDNDRAVLALLAAFAAKAFPE